MHTHSHSLHFMCLLNFISDYVVFTLPAHKPLHTSHCTHGPVMASLVFFLLHRVAACSHCATTENTGIGCVCWQVAALLLHPSLSPTALWVKSFHISTETLLIAHGQFPGKSNNVSSISLTGIKRIHVAAVTWLVLHTTLVTAQTK